MLIRMGAAGLGARRSGFRPRAIGDHTESKTPTVQPASQPIRRKWKHSEGKTVSRTRRSAAPGQIDQTLFDMDRALGLRRRRCHGPSTRSAASTTVATRSLSLLLQKPRVDDASSCRSDQRRNLEQGDGTVLGSAPHRDQQVWIEWIRPTEALRRSARLSTGNRADPASAAQVDQFSQQGQGDF